MLVDDDPVAMRVHGQLLASQGHRIVPVASADEALSTIICSPPDLVISDVMMLKVDGIELARSLRAKPVMRDVPIMLVSVLDDRETRVRAEEVADHFMAKPLDGLEFVLRVSLLLRQRARVLELRAENESLRAEVALLKTDNERLGELRDAAMSGRHSFERADQESVDELYTAKLRLARRG